MRLPPPAKAGGGIRANRSNSESLRRPSMNAMKLFLLLAALALAVPGFGQGRQTRPGPGAISPDATSDCQSTFTSGSGQTFFQFCVTVNGNVTELQSPAGFEHIREGLYM